MMRWTVCVVAIVTVVGCGKPSAPAVPKASFKPSKETTYITEPIDANGYLDYETALNEKLRGKITPESNAVVLFWQAIGPKPEGREVHADYFKWLQIERPDTDGIYYKDWVKFSKDAGTDKTEEELLDARYTALSSIPWTAKAVTDYAAWLTANEKPLEVLFRATQRSEYFNALVSRNDKNDRGVLINSPLQHLQSLRSMADALATRAMLHIGEGRFEAAWSDLLTIRRLGRLIARGGTLIELLVGIAVDGLADRATAVFVEQRKANLTDASRYLAGFQKLPPFPKLAEKLDRSERFTLLDIFQSAQKNGFDSLREISGGKPAEAPDAATRLLLQQLDWDIIFRTATNTYDRVGKIFDHADRGTRKKEWSKFEAELRQQRKELGDNTNITKLIREGGQIDKAVSEKVATILVTLLFPAVDRIQMALERAQQQQHHVHLAFALAAYRADHGKYPAKLDDLAPNYLAKIPTDVFADKPLIYKPADGGYLLYSVGENGTDDGGASFGDEPRGDDLTVRMPAKK